MKAEQTLQVELPAGVLDAVCLMPANPQAMLVFAHGAGAGYRHASMQALAESWFAQNLATLRFNFPFMQAGKRRVDDVPTSTAAIAAAVGKAQSLYDLPIFLAGHSFGGRMNSHAVADKLVNCHGLIYCSFPLHGAKKPATKRATHLSQVGAPMLFLSGDRDDLADASLLAEIVSNLPQAQIHWLETANHSYVTLKRARTNPLDVFTEMGHEAANFVRKVLR